MNSNKRLHALAVSDSGFIFDPSTGQTFTTNEIGLEIIRLLKEGEKLEEIISYISEHYDADEDLVYKDTVQFLSQLRTYRLIDET